MVLCTGVKVVHLPPSLQAGLRGPAQSWLAAAAVWQGLTLALPCHALQGSERACIRSGHAAAMKLTGVWVTRACSQHRLHLGCAMVLQARAFCLSGFWPGPGTAYEHVG